MNKKIFLYICILLLSSVLLTGCTKKEEEVVEEEEQVVEQQEESIVKEDLGTLSNPEDFTKTKQSLGQSSDFKYTVSSIEDFQKDGYHEFKFVLTSTEEGAVTPLFTVEPILEKGVLRITLKNIVADSSAVTFSSGIDVDAGAITGLYRTVTSLENTRIYDIGILTNNAFRLDLVDDSVGEWVYLVKVAYDTKYSPPTIDFGSTEFSSDDQSITGMNAQDGAKITTYSYSTSGGILKFVFSVASGASNPIPSVDASYDEAGMLIVTFPSLTSDKVSTWGSTITLPGGVQVFVSRSGEASTYKFGGISGKKPFKLSATQSPNSVIVEIKL